MILTNTGTKQKRFPTSKSFQHVSNVNTTSREFIPENCFAPKFRGYTYLAPSILDINRTKILIIVYFFMGLVTLKIMQTELTHSTTAVVHAENADAYFAKAGIF